MGNYNAGIGTPYWYEWEIGLLKCLDMLYDDDIEGVAFQSSDFQSLDDVVVFYKNKRSINIQVKHTDIDKNFTCSTLLSGEESMLQNWANDWVKNEDRSNIIEIKIISNKKFGLKASKKYCSFVDFVSIVLPNLKINYNYKFTNEKQNNTASKIKEQLSNLGDCAIDFIKLLNFEYEGDIDELDKKIFNKIGIILGTKDKDIIKEKSLELFGRLKEWTTSQRTKEFLQKEDVYKVLCKLSAPAKYKYNPETPIFPSRIRFANKFIKILNECERKIVFLQGLPGSGKTNFISYLSYNFSEIVDFRFYTYLPIKLSTNFFNNDSGYFSGKFLWTTILFQLKEKFEAMHLLSEYNFPLIYDYLNDVELKKIVFNYLSKYASITKKTCNIFIDGIDHAARYNGNTFLSELPMPDEIPENVKFVLVGQPLHDKYPSWIQSNNNILKICLPILEDNDVTMLLNKYKISFKNINIDILSNKIIDLVGNNALNIIFAICECTKISTNNYDEFFKKLKEKKLCNMITKYYEWIINSLGIHDIKILKMLTLFAFATQKLTIEEISLSCNINFEEVVYHLNKLFPLVQENNGVYYVFHNDVKNFFKDYVVNNSNFTIISSSLKNTILKKEELITLNYFFLFDMLVESDQSLEAINLFNVEYIVKSLNYGIPFTLLYKQLEKIFTFIINCKDFNLINKFSLSVATMSQYYGCILWSDKGKKLIEDDEYNELTFCEIYIIEIPKNFEMLINDIYNLCLHKKNKRAKKLYNKYLVNIDIKDILGYLYSYDKTMSYDLAEKFGYIHRCFHRKLLYEVIDSEYYSRIFNGWINGSINNFSLDELVITFSFKKFEIRALCDYFNKLDSLRDESSFYFLVNVCLKNENIPLSCLIDLCVKGILNNYESKNLISILSNKYKNLLNSREFNFNQDKILYFFKILFCIYPNVYLTKSDELKEVYKEILLLSHIDEKERGYKPAMEQFRLCEQSINNFYTKDYDINKDVETTYFMGFIDKLFGVGSANDSNFMQVRNFVFNIIFNTLTRRDNKIINDFCNQILSIYIEKEPRFFDQFISLYSKANMEKEFMQIFDVWAGNNGIIWKESFGSIDYIYSSITIGLKTFNKVNENRKLKLRRNMKFLSYIGHKDYSLSETLSIFKNIDVTPQIFCNQCIELLRVSDYASDIGDNRIASSINEFLFYWAVKLGPKFAHALFELKNDRENFYLWRTYFLNAYYELLNNSTINNDEEICSFLDIYNAWTKIEIEGEDRYAGEDKVNYLKNKNYGLMQRIKDNNLKALYIKKYPNSLAKNIKNNEISSIVKVDTEENLIIDELLDEIKEQSLGDRLLTNIRAKLKNLKYKSTSFLEQTVDILKEQEKKTFVSDIIMPYIIENFEYSFHSNGSNRLISTYRKYMNEQQYLDLFNNIFNKTFKKGYEYLYAVSEDIETLLLNYYLHFNNDKLINLINDRLKMHIEWITGANSLDFENYSIVIDNNIKSLKSLRDRLLNI